MIIVAIHHRHIGPEEIIPTPVAVLIGRAHMVEGSRVFQVLGIPDFPFLGISAIGFHARAGCRKKSKFHLDHLANVFDGLSLFLCIPDLQFHPLRDDFPEDPEFGTLGQKSNPHK